MDVNETQLISANDLAGSFDDVCNRVLHDKLNSLFDSEVKTLQQTRLLQVGKESPVEVSKKIRQRHEEKSFAAEHRIELLLQSQELKDIDTALTNIDMVAQYGETRLMNQIDANVQAIVEVVPAFSAQILAHRKSVHDAFVSDQYVEKLVDMDFQALRKYYTSCQASLDAKFATQEKMYLKYELDSMDAQLKTMNDIFNNSRNAPSVNISTEESHRRCDELYKWFCDRTLELQYANSTLKQDCEWRKEDAQVAANKWRFGVSEELEYQMCKELCKIEEDYIARIEQLSASLHEEQQRQHDAQLARLRLSNLSKIPPFALKMAIREKEAQHALHVERMRRQGSQVQIGSDDAPVRPQAYLPEVGTHVVEFANATKLQAEQLVEELHVMLLSVSSWQSKDAAATSSNMFSSHPEESNQLLRTLTAMLHAAQKEKKMTDVQSIPSPSHLAVKQVKLRGKR